MHSASLIRSRWIAWFLCIGLVLSAGAVQAQEAPGPLADTWVIWVKPGHEAQFDEGIKAHLAWRKSGNEPFTWIGYQPVVGDDLAHYVFRSQGHHWKDFDALRQWEVATGADAKFFEQVGPHMDRAEHYISQLDTEHSHWTDDPGYAMFGVSSYEVRPGMQGELNRALTTIHKAAMDGKWSRSYAIARRIGGGGGLTIATPYKTFADMRDPDPSFMKVVATSLGSAGAAEAAFKSFGECIAKQSYTVYAMRPDLSTPK